MLPVWVKKLGKTKLVLMLTIFSSIFSVGLSAVINLAMNGYVAMPGLVNAFAIPLILTPVIAIFFFRVLFQLDDVSSQLLLLSNTDELTGAHNRRYFFEHLDHELSLARRYGQVFSLLMIDIDDFKQINDEYGHPAGDAILGMFAEICQRESRNVDEFARLGGDEFGYLLPGLPHQGAQAFANRIRTTLENSKVQYRGNQLQATVSIGVITWTEDLKNSEAIIYLIDKALQNAKQSGKNVTVVAGQNL